MPDKPKSAETRRPVVGIPCDYRMLGPHPFHAVGEKYIAAIEGGAGAFPLLIPVLPDPLATDEILARVDGLLFTGSPSNVHPGLYGGPAAREGVLHDTARDATTIPLLRRAIEEVPGRFDHRENKNDPLEMQYGPAHDVAVAPGGILETIAKKKDVTCPSFAVNSLHAQGIDRLAPGLLIEATAPDGQIEAVTVKGARGFVLAVQWHPEWRYWENKMSTGIFEAFGGALRAQAAAARN